jgi:flagellar basal-body rod protein FlgB
VIDDLISTPTTRVLEGAVNFTEQRHQVLLENIANLDVPGYIQKDLNVGDFQSSLRNALDRERASVGTDVNPASTETIDFSQGASNPIGIPQQVIASPVFHDKGARSIDSLMSNLADNALAHNTAVQLLKYSYDRISRAISMKV